MKWISLMVVAALLVMPVSAQLAHAESFATQAQYCDAAQSGKDFTTMENCEQRFKNLKAQGKNIPLRWLTVVAECGMALVEAILFGACGAVCIETFGAACVACIGESGFLVAESMSCANAICEAAGGGSYHYDPAKGKCVK